MKRNTLQELFEIIKIHYKNGENLAGAVRKTRTFLGRREEYCRTAIKKLVEKFYPQRVTVWGGLWSGEDIGPYFLENEAGATVTVNGLRYREMINDFLWPKLDSIDLDNVYFQQDGGECHTSNLSLEEVITNRHRDLVF